MINNGTINVYGKLHAISENWTNENDGFVYEKEQYAVSGLDSSQYLQKAPLTEAGDFKVSGGHCVFDDASRTLIIKSGTTHVSMKEENRLTSDKIKVENGAVVTIVLEGVNIQTKQEENGFCALDLTEAGDTTITLGEGSVNNLKAFRNHAAIEIPNGKLTINGTGTLEVASGEYYGKKHAGIRGTDPDFYTGELYIESGNIIANNGVSKEAGIQVKKLSTSPTCDAVITSYKMDIEDRSNKGTWSGFFNMDIDGKICGNQIIKNEHTISDRVRLTIGEGSSADFQGKVNNHGDIHVYGTLKGVDEQWSNGSGGQVYELVKDAVSGLSLGKYIPFPVEDTNNKVGDFNVTGGTLGKDFTYNKTDKVLTIIRGTELTIKNAKLVPTEDTISVAQGVAANVILNGVNIKTYKRFENSFGLKDGASVTMTLSPGSTNTLQGGEGKPGIYVPDGTSLTIKGTGSLIARGLGHGAGIGGGINDNGTKFRGIGKIRIENGTVLAEPGKYGAGIGGGTIGSGGEITISGGFVIAKKVHDWNSPSRGIGWGKDGANGAWKFSTGTNGNAIIMADTIGPKENIESWQGIIFDGNDGKIYGTQTLGSNLEIEKERTLTILAGNTLTIPSGKTLTNKGKIINKGTITNDLGAIIDNYGSIENVSVEQLVNNGTINDYGTITPKPDGEIAEKAAVTVTFAIKKGTETGTPVTEARYEETIVVTATIKKAETRTRMGSAIDTVDFYLETREGKKKLSTVTYANGEAQLEVKLTGIWWAAREEPYIITADFGGTKGGLLANTGTGTLKVNVKQGKTPVGGINYFTKNLTNLTGEGNYEITKDSNVENIMTNINGTLDISADWFGQTIAIVQKGDDYSTDSQAQSLTIPALPSTPTIPTAVDGGVKDTSITLATVEGAEYKLDNGNWQDSNEFTGLTVNTNYTLYQRIKATSNSFSSEESSADIKTDTTILKATSVTASSTYGQVLSRITPSGAVTGNSTPVAGLWQFKQEGGDLIYPTVGGAVSYTATFTPTENAANYKALTVDIVPTIIPKALTDAMIGEISGTYTYNGTVHNPELTVTDVSNGVSNPITTTDYIVSYSNNINGGTATAIIKASDGSNYSGSASKTFTISPATPTVTVTATKKIADELKNTKSEALGNYNDVIVLTAKVEGATDMSIPTGTVTFKAGNTTLLSENSSLSDGTAKYEYKPLAGNHSVTAEYVPGTNETNYNNASSTQTEFNIAKAEQVTLTITSPGLKTYGDSEFTLVTSGGNGNGAVTYTVTENNGVITIDGDKATIIGTVTVTATKAAEDNYNATTADLDIIVAKKTPTLAWEATSQSQTIIYTGVEASIVAPIRSGVGKKVPEGEISYQYKEDDSQASKSNYVDGLPTEAGAYVVKAKMAQDGNYTEADSNNELKLSISKAPTTIDTLPKSSEIIYGQTLSTSKLSDGKANVEGTFSWLDTVSLEMPVAGKATHGIIFKPTDQDNYTDVESSVEVRVNKKELTPSITVVGVTKVYDGETSIVGTTAPSLKLTGGIGEETPTATANYAYDSADAGLEKTIKATDITLKADDQVNINYTLSTDVAEKSGAVIINAEQVAPNKPDISEESSAITDNSITIKTVAGQKYMYTTTTEVPSIETGIWIEGNGEPHTFAELMRDTQHYIWTYKINIANYNDSPVSESLEVKTEKELIKDVDVLGIEVPIRRDIPDISADNGLLWTAGVVSWFKDSEPVKDRFGYRTIYTAQVTLTANNGYKFADDVEVKVDGITAEVTRDNDKTLLVSYTYPKTSSKPIVEEIVIAPPSIVTPPATPEQPNPPTMVEIEVVGKTDDDGDTIAKVEDEIIIDAIKKAQVEIEKQGTQENGIDFIINIKTEQDVNSIEIILSSEMIDKLIATEIIQLTIKNNLAPMALDLATLNVLSGGEVRLKISKVDVSRLSKQGKTAIGRRPAFSFTSTSGGEKVTDFKGGKVELQIPYTPIKNEKSANLKGVYVDSSGNVTWLDTSKYDTRTNTQMISTSHFSVFGIGYKEHSSKFTDIAEHWAKDDIEFITTRGVLSGTSETTFSPNQNMTRGMFVTAIGRLENEDISSYNTSSFSDVTANSYYLGYVEWANKNRITSGVGNGQFAPEQSISRQEMAVMLQNYAKVKGYQLPIIHKEILFRDNIDIEAWANPAVKEMQRAGILMGKDNFRFDPNGVATRAEVSAMLCRLLELVGDKEINKN